MASERHHLLLHLKLLCLRGEARLSRGDQLCRGIPLPLLLQPLLLLLLFMLLLLQPLVLLLQSLLQPLLLLLGLSLPPHHTCGGQGLVDDPKPQVLKDLNPKF